MKTVTYNLGREYRVATTETVTEIITVTSKQLFEEHETTGTEPEVIYALRDKIDEVLRLEKGQSMYFQPNRDNGDSKGIIKRIH